MRTRLVLCTTGVLGLDLTYTGLRKYGRTYGLWLLCSAASLLKRRLDDPQFELLSLFVWAIIEVAEGRCVWLERQAGRPSKAHRICHGPAWPSGFKAVRRRIQSAQQSRAAHPLHNALLTKGPVSHLALHSGRESGIPNADVNKNLRFLCVREFGTEHEYPPSSQVKF
jgi:hypothetical protein